MEKILKVEGMMCNHCKARIEKGLTTLGLTKFEVDLKEGTLKFDDDGLSVLEIKELIRDLGFDTK